MKKIITLVAAMLFGLSCTAFAQTSTLSRNSTHMKSLNMAWNAYKYAHPKPDKNDITMVYGGEDISRRPTLVPHLATA